MRPLLQVALDYIQLDEPLRVASAVSKNIDILEAGTPLIKSEGLRAVRELAKFGKPVSADMKAADTGALEAKIAFDAGAEYASVLGGAPLLTIRGAVEEANRQNKKISVDLIGVEDVPGRVRCILEICKPHIFEVHAGIDEQNAGRSPFEMAKELGEMGVSFSVAGGIKLETVEKLAGISPAIIIVGGGITKQPNPAEVALRIREKIAEIW